MSKVIKHTELTDTLAITECTDGFWLYDETRGMNLAMKCKTEQSAFVQALEYYQQRLTEVEQNHNNLSVKVSNFIDQFISDDE